MLETLMKKIEMELNCAMQNYPPIRSYHEGYAVLKEELDELWDEIKKYKYNNPTNVDKIEKEAIQVAAITIRLVLDSKNFNNTKNSIYNL